jgi:hypothetical protein
MKGFNGLLKDMHNDRIPVCRFYLRQFTNSYDASGAVILACIGKSIYFCCHFVVPIAKLQIYS